MAKLNAQLLSRQTESSAMAESLRNQSDGLTSELHAQQLAAQQQITQNTNAMKQSSVETAAQVVATALALKQQTDRFTGHHRQMADLVSISELFDFTNDLNRF